MVHTAKNKTLGRKKEARKALLVNQSNALLQNKRIITTITKAKMLARFVAPIITQARSRSYIDNNHAHRSAFSTLRNKKSVHMLFNDILPQIKERPGGYTRIIKLQSFQKGDGANLALIELVDFNPLLEKTKKTKTRRSRRKKMTPPDTSSTVKAKKQDQTNPVTKQQEEQPAK